MNTKRIIAGFLVALLAITVRADVVLPKMFGDNMVLLQQSPCNIWGTTSPGKVVKIKASWDKRQYAAKADKTGHFSIQIQTPNAGGPYVITFNDGKETRLNNILIGEVWICSGQSNMEMQMKGFKAQPVEGATEELMDCNDSQLRLFTVKRNSQLMPVDTVSGAWFEASTASVRDFSATAYYFGKALRRNLKVPVGLIVVAWGGSACEAWMNAEWLKAFPTVKVPHTPDDIWSKNRTPTVLYNGMLRPLIGYTMRGVIWYQGEDNVNRYETYAGLLSTMIQGWRNDWHQGDFPFYYCQIAPYDYSLIDWNYNSAYLREQQSKVETMVENCRMAVLMDAGLEYGIHPRKKKVAGERLALLSLANTYGQKGLPEFAAYSSVEFKGDTAVVAFDRSKEWIYFNNGPKGNNFEIAGEDKVYHHAEAWVDRNRVYVHSNEVKHPVAVRYGFHDWVDGDLFHDGLPVSSFRTDNW